MKRILVVDDEKFIRLGLEALINNSFDYVETVLARNGKEAFEKITESDFDLVITDINMPVMTGIELIKSIYNANINVKVIVLSGFNEFEYARQCMKYGVKNYLLKPIENDELVSSIKEIFEAIEEEKIFEKNSLIKELKYEVKSGYKNYEDLNKLLESLNLKFSLYKCYYLRTKNRTEIVQKNYKEKNILFIPNELYDGYLISENDVDLNMEEYDFVAESNTEKSVVKAFETVKELKKYRMILGKSHIKSEDTKGRKYIFINTKEIADIYDYIKMGKYELIKEILDQVFLEKKIKQYDYKTFEEIHKSIIRNIFDKLSKDMDSLNNLNKEFENLEFSNLNEYLDELMKTLKNLTEYLNENNKIEKMHIEKAKEYINNNYNKDLNMAVVSNYVSLNYSYFSSLFKKYMNMNFLDYLNIVRVEKSKEYLVKIDYKIYEISDLVGYKNPKHFSKIFKKIEKITPVEYKLKNMER